MMCRRRKILGILVCGGALAVLTACPGEDYLPVYFPTAEGEAVDTPRPNVTPPTDTAACTTQFTAQLCVVIKGEQLEVGTTDPLCSDVPPIPLEIRNGTITMRGNTVPDIVVEGHGLPVPITINGRGTGSGRDNVGTGTISAAGDITITGFDFYVTALDSVGKIPNLTFTTSQGPVFQHTSPVEGSVLTPNGDLTLVSGTTLGSLFPSADKYLLGAAMTATFRGRIAPTLDACGAQPARPTTVEVMRLIIDAQGAEVAVPIPNGSQMEISASTFVARSPGDIGPRFESVAKFSIVNISKQPLAIHIPPVVGVFQLESPTGLNRTLPPGGSMRLRVTFTPIHNEIDAPGTVTKTIQIGPDLFTLSGVAVEPQGKVAIDLLDRHGASVRERIDVLHVGDRFTTTSPQRAYFQCTIQICGGSPLPSRCQPCLDVTTGACQLLVINTEGQPLDAVTETCAPQFLRQSESQVINLRGELATLRPIVQVLAIRNIGTTPLTVTDVTIQEIAESASMQQFVLDRRVIFVADTVDAIREQLQAAAAGAPPSKGPTFPITLPPYEPPLRTTRAFLVLAYAPTDLVGSDGRVAGVGATVIDQALLQVESDGIGGDVRLKGTTTIQESPALQVVFSTMAGRKEQPDGSTFAFRSITMETENLAVPLFIRLSESATRAIRITGVRIEGPEAAHFSWLDSPEELDRLPEASRCSSPTFNPSGEILDVQTALTPVILAPHGYDLTPENATAETMPFFGCVNFQRETTATISQRQFEALLIIVTQPLGPDKKPLRNPDGSLQQSEYRIPLLAVISPRKGKMVFRITQTMSAMLNPQFPTFAAAPARNELDTYIAAGQAKIEDRFLFTGAFILDPFDEETMTNEAGEIVSTPNDGITAVFRKIDTRPTSMRYEDPLLRDYALFSYDATAPVGQRGQFFDYPNVPADLRANGLKIFTSTLSYPGPLVPFDEKPLQPSQCEVVDPCSEEGKQKFGSGPTAAGKKGVCTFFYTSAGAFTSPAFHSADEMAGGDRRDLCEYHDTRQPITDITGAYTLDGRFTFDVGLRFWGPTYVHNPGGPIGTFPPLDEVWHLNLTTETLRPPKTEQAPNLVPDPRVNIGKQEYKINLNDPTLETPQLCPNNTANLTLQGTSYSSWSYLRPLISKDEEGLIPAGCPEAGNTFTGGTAFVHGRRLDHETGILSVVGTAKFSARDELTFFFKDVIVFVALNGWLCDPTGDPAQWEGERCYDLELNVRDEASQISIIRGR